MVPHDHLLRTLAILHSLLLSEYQYHYIHPPIHPLKKKMLEEEEEREV